MTAERGGPPEQRFVVQVRDDDASGSGIVLVFGDGEQLLRPPPVATCAAGPQPSREPRPFDTAYDVLHIRGARDVRGAGEGHDQAALCGRAG